MILGYGPHGDVVGHIFYYITHAAYDQPYTYNILPFDNLTSLKKKLKTTIYKYGSYKIK